MGDHAHKEHRIEPGEWALETSDQAPCNGEEDVAAIIDLASVGDCSVISICPHLKFVHLHQPSMRMVSPLSVFRVFGLSICTHGIQGNQLCGV